MFQVRNPTLSLPSDDIGIRLLDDRACRCGGKIAHHRNFGAVERDDVRTHFEIAMLARHQLRKKEIISKKMTDLLDNNFEARIEELGRAMVIGGDKWDAACERCIEQGIIEPLEEDVT